MRIVRGLAFWLAVLLLVAVVAVMVIQPKYRVVITQQQAQQAVQAKLPYAAPPKAFLRFTVHEGATVRFGEDGRIAVAGRFTAQPTMAQVSRFDGRVAASGVLAYERGAFYIREVKLTDVGGELVLSGRAQTAGRLLGRLAEKAGVTKDVLDVDKMKAELPDILAKKLASTPIYKLDGKMWWHWMASDAIDSITVVDQIMTVQVSLSQVMLNILLGFALFVVAVLMTFAIMASGSAGVFALLAFS